MAVTCGPRRWYVAFVDSGRVNHWWHLFTRPGFRHCHAFGRDERAGVWLRVEWCRGGLYVWALTNAQFRCAIELALANGTVL